MAQSKKKKPAKKQFPVTQVFLGLAILLVVALITAIFSSRYVKTDKTVLVSSGQESILSRQYMYFLNSMRYEYESDWTNNGYVTSASEMAELWNTVEDGLTWGDHLKTYALESAKNLFTELYLAKQAGFSVTPELIASTSADIDNVVSSVFANSNTPNTDFFNSYGLTIEEMKTLQAYINLVNEWRNSVYDLTTVTDEQAMNYFLDNSYYIDSVVVRHVLIATGDMDDDEIAAAEEFAEEILQQINDGSDIGELAALYSDDPGSADNNGEYEFGRGEMVSEFEDWAFAAEVGDTGIVETSYGYHVMQLMRAPLSFEDLKDQLLAAVQDEEAASYIEDAIASANFDWKLNESAYKKIKF